MKRNACNKRYFECLQIQKNKDDTGKCDDIIQIQPMTKKICYAGHNGHADSPHNICRRTDSSAILWSYQLDRFGIQSKSILTLFYYYLKWKMCISYTYSKWTVFETLHWPPKLTESVKLGKRNSLEERWAKRWTTKRWCSAKAAFSCDRFWQFWIKT